MVTTYNRDEALAFPVGVQPEARNAQFSFGVSLMMRQPEVV